MGIIVFNNNGDGIVKKNYANMNNNLIAENPRLLAPSQCEVQSRQRRPQRSRGLRGEQRGGLGRVSDVVTLD